MHNIYHGYCRSVWEEKTGTQLKWKVKRDIRQITMWKQKVSGKIVLASICTCLNDVSAILNSHLQWTPSLSPILNELRIANFPELLISSLML